MLALTAACLLHYQYTSSTEGVAGGDQCRRGGCQAGGTPRRGSSEARIPDGADRSGGVYALREPKPSRLPRHRQCSAIVVTWTEDSCGGRLRRILLQYFSWYDQTSFRIVFSAFPVAISPLAGANVFAPMLFCIKNAICTVWIGDWCHFMRFRRRSHSVT